MTQPKSLKWLDDIRGCCANIAEWTTTVNASSYAADGRLRAAVERNFEIIGEALARIERTDPETAASITDYRRIIGFRNRLAHGYDDIDDVQVWDVIQIFLPILRSDVELLLQTDNEQ